MNREALKRTVESGEAVYWSRSRKKLWHKARNPVTCRKCTKFVSTATKTSFCCKWNKWGYRLSYRKT